MNTSLSFSESGSSPPRKSPHARAIERAKDLLRRQKKGWDRVNVDALTVQSSAADLVEAAHELGMVVQIVNGNAWAIIRSHRGVPTLKACDRRDSRLPDEDAA